MIFRLVGLDPVFVGEFLGFYTGSFLAGSSIGLLFQLYFNTVCDLELSLHEIFIGCDYDLRDFVHFQFFGKC